MALELSPGIFSVGVADPDMRFFDVVVPTAYGSSYNSYLVKGETATALIETVHAKKTEEYIANIQKVVDISQIDYIVMDHTEPDHSGSLQKLLSLAPKAKVIASASAIKFLKEIANSDFESIPATNALKIDLGGKTLQFIISPNLHWPDSMFTYIPESKALFTCDFLGSHYYEEGHPLLSKIARLDDYDTALKVYYDCIFSPFKKFVLSGLQKIEPLNVSLICPSHGPVLDDGFSKVIEKFRDWSADDSTKNSAVIAYASSYGYTKSLADAAEEVLKSRGFSVKSFDLGVTPVEIAAAEADKASLLFIGSPTFNRNAILPVWEFIAHLSAISNVKKKVGVFGSYGWSGEAIPLICAHLKLLKFDVCGDGFRAVFKPSSKELSEMKAYVESCLL